MSVQVLPDIPRFYTALAEWLACLVYIIPLRKRVTGISLLAVVAGAGFLQFGIHYLAGLVHPFFWLGWMFFAVAVMFGFIWTACSLSAKDVGFYTIRAFIIAEFAASFEWQIHYFVMKKGQGESGWDVFLLVIIYAAVFTSVFLIERRHLPRGGRLEVRLRELWTALLIGGSVFLMSNISFVYQNTPFSSTMGSELLYIRTLVDFAGIIMLYAQMEQRKEAELRRELAGMDGILRKQYDRYRLSKENDELISRKYHDLKHQIAVIRAESNPAKKEAYLKEMDRALRRHEAENRTGNGVLDTILFSKAMYCSENNIQFTCVADGSLLDFMDVMDICTIFGNALDNAIESVEKIKDSEKRLISMTVASQNDFLIIRFENYFESTVKMDDGMPLTTKRDRANHGFGIKSIRLVAEKYQGSLTVHTEGQWFSLRILIPNRTHEEEKIGGFG